MTLSIHIAPGFGPASAAGPRSPAPGALPAAASPLTAARAPTPQPQAAPGAAASLRSLPVAQGRPERSPQPLRGLGRQLLDTLDTPAKKLAFGLAVALIVASVAVSGGFLVGLAFGAMLVVAGGFGVILSDIAEGEDQAASHLPDNAPAPPQAQAPLPAWGPSASHLPGLAGGAPLSADAAGAADAGRRAAGDFGVFVGLLL